MDRFFLCLASVLGFLGVALGAFAAHGLKGRLSPDLLAIFEVGVRYHMYHALALLAVGILLRISPDQFSPYVGWAFVGGITIFSGSLFILAISGIRWLGAITPIGGVLFLIGWALLAWHTFRG